MSSPLRVVLTAEAEGDLQAIYDQRLTHRGAQGVDGADALLDRVYDAIASLAAFSNRGPVPPELATLGIAEWRQLSVPPYRIIYACEADAVTVAVVADSRRDFSRLLERRLLQSRPRS